MIKPRLPRTLFGRLVLAQIAFGAVAAMAYLIGLNVSHGHLHLTAMQAQNLSLAVQLLRQQRELFGSDLGDPRKVQGALDRLGAVNPSVDLYWLSPTGKILGSSVPPERLRATQVDMAPLESLLTRQAELPVLGQDPADPGAPKVFSIAGVGDPSEPAGYLYVVLRGDDLGLIGAMTRSHIFWESLSIALGVTALALASTLVIVFGILRPFKRLSTAMDSFQKSDFTNWTRVDDAHSGRGASDLDRLIGHYNDMAARITQLIEQLRDDDRKMREMFANISHDLRTPLTIIQGSLETLHLKGERFSPAERGNLLNVTLAQARTLSGLVTGLFELAKLQSPHYRLRGEPFSLADLLQDVSMKFSVRASEKGVRISNEGLGRHAPVIGDAALIERALDNLIGNALNHASGATTVLLRLAERPSDYEVAVIDNGCGISESKAKEIARGDDGARGFAGTTGNGSGLGLLIVRSVLALHGSSLVVKTRPGAGSSFAFSLPKAQATGDAASQGAVALVEQEISRSKAS